MTHTGEKPFAYSLCDKKFIEKSNLDKNEWTHTGESLFTCLACENVIRNKKMFDGA